MDSVNQKYLEKFEELEAEYDECSELLGSVEIMTDNKLFVHYQKKLKTLESVVLAFKKYKDLNEESALSKELADVENNEEQKDSCTPYCYIAYICNYGGVRWKRERCKHVFKRK